MTRKPTIYEALEIRLGRRPTNAELKADIEMSNLHISETWVNATKGHGVGQSGIYETFTDDLGELYRRLRGEYGRCISRIYIDCRVYPGHELSDTKPIGWVFQKRRQYEDCDETYLAETWVEVIELAA